METNELLSLMSADIRDFRKEVISKLDSLTSNVAELDKQISVQAKEIEFIKQEDVRTNTSLEEHIAGVKELRAQNILLKDQFYSALEEKNQTLERRIRKLESPREWIKGSLWVIGVLTAIAYLASLILQIVPN